MIFLTTIQFLHLLPNHYFILYFLLQIESLSLSIFYIDICVTSEQYILFRKKYIILIMTLTSAVKYGSKPLYS